MATLCLRLATNTSRSARAAPALAHARRSRARYVHYCKELPYPINEGLGDFLSPEGLKMLAVDYHQGILDRLNEQVKDTELATKSIAQTVIDAARDPNKVLEFNYACEALNNSFFLENVKPPPPNASTHEAVLNTNEGGNLTSSIRTGYGSLAHLKSTFGAAVNGMFSSGWMWFVCDQQGNLGIYPTFGTGTLLVRSGESLERYQPARPPARAPAASTAQPTGSASTPSPTSPASGLSHAAPPLHPSTPSRTFSSNPIPQLAFVPRPANVYHNNPDSEQTEKNPERIGEILYPLFCVSVHERAWVGAGYGVWGKEEYIKRFWSVLDWDKVAANFNMWRGDARSRV
ncbi:Manganese/iron superoxide dismutase [Amylocystis lapponica]|nr:Manganese/iron superoxide dismutase [Amylocystis lapponica]